ncbi:MAG TPA: DNA-3-methyladenine glycosylase 2 family protein [Puia sp.]|jgi:DNA-3-methyladenine glycosylase II|nr:DNA-3-methyladenine glycosylase 2 family protein [Puia sp.]
MLNTFSSGTFHSRCDALAECDADLADIILSHGYPPMWNRPNTFETLVHFILEQQVSLASALAALNKLREYIREITPHNVLRLSDEELKACYFSRQKTGYVRYLAESVVNGQMDLDTFPGLSDDEVRTTLTSLKGIGNWTADVYLIFVLRRADIFPLGDLAAVNALKRVKRLPKDTHRDALLPVIDRWKPHRTIATMLLWHYYLSTGTRGS